MTHNQNRLGEPFDSEVTKICYVQKGIKIICAQHKLALNRCGIGN